MEMKTGIMKTHLMTGGTKEIKMKKLLKNIFTLSTMAFPLLLTGCYTWWQGKVDMDYVTEQANLADFFYVAPVITSLDSPLQVLASQGLYKDTIKIRWTEVENATSYRIERAVMSSADTLPDEGDFTVIKKYVYNNLYEDKILSNAGDSNEEYNNYYYYRVCAENIQKGYESSEYTDITSSSTCAKGWLLSPPQNVSAWKGKSTDTIRISWDFLEGARYYTILRSEKQKLGYEEVETIKGNKNYYDDELSDSEKGCEFYYKVYATLENGSSSEQSAWTLGYSLKEGAPAAPENVHVVDGCGQSTSSITIAWDNSISNQGGELTFNVFRTSSVDSSYTQIYSNLPDTYSQIDDKSSLKPGVYYYYYVQSVIEKDGEKSKSSFSESGPDSENPAVGFLLSPPSTYEITDADSEDCVIIRWLPAIGSEEPYNNSYTYNIYYDDTDKTVQGTTNILSFPPELCDDGYYEAEVTKHNFYKMSTSTPAGGVALESARSSAFAPNPQAPTNVTASKTSGEEELISLSYNTNEVYPVKISWNLPANDIPYGYYVYRSTKKDSSFRKLNDELSEVQIDSDGSFYFIDQNETARAGTYYYYKVVSVNELGKGNKSNDPENDSENACRGYGAITREQWFREYNKTIMSSQAKLTLMHKANDMDKLGSETIKGNISGTLGYNAAIAGLGAKITMPYTNYCDFYISDDEELGPYYTLNGNTDTSSNMSANGNMSGTVKCTGMYPGYAIYDNLEIKGGAAGGGYYIVQTYDLDNNTLLSAANVDWKVGEEH